MDFGFRVWFEGPGVRVSGLAFRIESLGVRVSCIGVGFRASDSSLEFRVSVRVSISNFKVQASVLGSDRLISGPGFRVSVFSLMVSDFGISISGSGLNGTGPSIARGLFCCVFIACLSVGG